MKRIFMTFLLLALGGCAVTLLDPDGNPGAFSPKPLFLKNLPQDDSNYSKGFRDGCYNFIGQTGDGFNRYYDRPARVDDNLLEDDLYQQGYSYGDRYCSVYVNNGIIL
jgi:hypothetical protein